MSVLRSYTPQISRRIPQVDRSVRLFQLAGINVMRQEPHLRNLRALLVDAAGTLIYPAQNVAKVFQRCKFKYIVNFDISVDSSPGSLDLLYHAPWIPSCIKNSTSVALLRVDIKHGCQSFHILSSNAICCRRFILTTPDCMAASSPRRRCWPTSGGHSTLPGHVLC